MSTMRWLTKVLHDTSFFSNFFFDSSNLSTRNFLDVPVPLTYLEATTNCELAEPTTSLSKPGPPPTAIPKTFS